jgi:FkbM family methyltransferase
MKVIYVGTGIGDDSLEELVNKNKTEPVVIVEANPFLFETLKKRFSYYNAILINRAIVPKELKKSEIDLYYSEEDDLLKNSSIHKDFLIKKGIKEESIKSLKVKCSTIEDLIDELGIDEIDYLILDTESIDGDLLLDVNLDKYHIKNIQYNYKNTELQAERLVKIVNQIGYVKSDVLIDLPNHSCYKRVGESIPFLPSIDIILRTHSFIDIHANPTPRYCGVDKTTLIEKCIKSLVQSANNYRGNINFIWFDDHSSKDMIDRVFEVFSKSKHPVEFNALEQRGWNASGHAQFDRGRSSTADLVYFVEDDYLHYPTAIEEMVQAYRTFKRNLGDEIAIHPYDDPDNYLPLFIDECRIVLGKKRHWRTNKYSTFTFMCNPDIVRKFWSRFYTVATEYMTEWGEKNQIQEGTTINHIWRWEVKLFTPIPSVALHMGYERQLDPFIDWKALWDSIG